VIEFFKSIQERLLERGDRATLIKRSANRQKELIVRHEFLTGPEFAKRAPDLIKDTENVDDALEHLQESNALLGMTINGIPHYPAGQIDPGTDNIYPVLATVIRLASDKGCSHWDIFEWMHETIAITPGGEYVGNARGIPKELRSSDLINTLKTNAKDRKQPVKIIPADLLLTGSEDTFECLAERWFGSIK